MKGRGLKKQCKNNRWDKGGMKTKGAKVRKNADNVDHIVSYSTKSATGPTLMMILTVDCGILLLLQ